MRINKIATINWINSLYIKYFNNEGIFIGLLKIVEFLSVDFGATGTTMAIAALLHENDEIKDAGVRIFESNYSIDGYNILKSIKIETDWLQEYINQVIIDIKSEIWGY